MAMKRLLSPRLACLVACASLVTGCAKESVKLAPVAGKVTVGGQPVTSGQVSLIPLSKEEKTPGLMTGTIDSSGNYKILTAGKDGAPLGKYKVTVTPAMRAAPADKKAPAMSYSQVFMDANKSTLTIEVVDNPPPGKYDLKLTR
jgi:hypothetical protein